MLGYRIRDIQFDCRYYANGAISKTKEEIREILIDYHSIDNDEDWLNTLSLDELLDYFEWRIEPVYLGQCDECGRVFIFTYDEDNNIAYDERECRCGEFAPFTTLIDKKKEVMSNG